jgi:hypothetical protein
MIPITSLGQPADNADLVAVLTVAALQNFQVLQENYGLMISMGYDLQKSVAK